VGRRNSIGKLNLIFFLELRGREHIDRIPGQLSANPGADLASDAFIKADLNGRKGDIVLIFLNSLDAIDGAEGNADLTTRAVVFIDNSDHLGLLFLLGDLCRKRGNGFIMIV